MAGIFIDEGPLGMLAEKKGEIITLKDFNRGTVYDGPLVILINGQSASASELLAAAIQDYHRGVVVGGASYGKATGQAVFPLDPGTQLNASLGSSDVIGFATVTKDRLYRVTGKSNQGFGVQPDVQLPDYYEAPAFHEFSQSRAFSQDSVAKKAFFHPLPVLPLAILKSNSFERTQNDSSFNWIASIGKELDRETMVSKEPILLKWENFILTGNETVRVNAVRNKSNAFYEVTSPEFNKIRIGMDAYLKAFTQTWTKNLKEDPYVVEAFRITCDYIQWNSKK